MSNSQHAAKDSKPAEKQTRVEAQPDQAQAVAELAAQGMSGKRITPADLPTESNSRGLRQASVLQLQRDMGSRFVQRYLAGQGNGRPDGDGARASQTEVEKGAQEPGRPVAQQAPERGPNGEMVQRKGPAPGPTSRSAAPG